MLHPSRIFVFLMTIFLFITAYATLNKIRLVFPFYIYFIICFIIIILWKAKIIRYVLLIVLVIIMALWRVNIVTPKNEPSWVNHYIGQEKKFVIRIIEEPKISGKSQRITAKVLEPQISGNIQLTTNQFPAYHFGDNLLVQGAVSDLSRDSEEYRGYFKAQNVYAFMKYPRIEGASAQDTLTGNLYIKVRQPLMQIRKSYEKIINNILPEPQAGLLSGILLGSRADIPTELLTLLSITGTIHIIALSGYNITIVAKFMQILTKNLSRKLSFYVPVLGIIAFVLATGLSASVIRAAIMGIMLLFAKKLGRKSDAMISILFASVVMVFANPYILLYDVGFQLSFTAVAGIIFLAPKIEKYFIFLGRYLGPMLAATISAQIFSWPITSYYFGLISVIAPLANLLILPFIPFLMLLGFMVATIGFASLWLSKTLGIFLWFILDYFTLVVKFLASTTFSAKNWQIKSPYLLIGYYFLLIDVILVLRRKRTAKKTVS